MVRTVISKSDRRSQITGERSCRSDSSYDPSNCFARVCTTSDVIIYQTSYAIIIYACFVSDLRFSCVVDVVESKIDTL